MSYVTREIKAASRRGRRMAKIRWDRDRERRAVIAAMEPMKFPGRIIKRIVVIEREVAAREIVFYEFDRYSDRKRKLQQVRALAF